MTINTIANGEPGSSVLGKLNQAISQLNASAGQQLGYAPLSVAGLDVTVGALSVGSVTYPGGSITLLDNTTQYLVLALHTQTLHTLDRLLDTTVLPLATFTTAGGVATLDDLPPLSLPVCHFPVAAQKLARGEATQITAIGSSLIRGAGSSPRWAEQVFSATYAANGYNPPSLADITFTNSALGGTDAWYSAALIGNPTFATSTDGTDAMVYCIDPKTIQRTTRGANAYQMNQKMSQSSVLGADLVIVGLLPNGGYDQLPYFEGVVRKLRQRGIEVMIVTDNEYAAQSLIYDKAPSLAAWAKKYGCALVDTAAFVKEQADRGNDPYYDGIHMNAVGHDAWSAAVSGALSGHYGNMVYRDVPQTLLAGADFPAGVDVCFDFDTSVDTAPVSRTSGGNASAFTNVFGQPTDYVPLTTGQILRGGHPLALGFYLIIDGGSAFSATLSTNDGATTATVSADGSQTRADVLMLRNVGDSHNKAFTLTVDSGTLRVVAVCYIVPHYEDITTHIQATDSVTIHPVSGTSLTKVKKTNTVDEGLYVSHPACRSLGVLMYGGPAAGQVRTFFTGRALYSEDLYKASVTLEYRDHTGNGVAEMSVASLMNGVNGSASATSSDDHRLAWVNAFAILDR